MSDFDSDDDIMAVDGPFHNISAKLNVWVTSTSVLILPELISFKSMPVETVATRLVVIAAQNVCEPEIPKQVIREDTDRYFCVAIYRDGDQPCTRGHPDSRWCLLRRQDPGRA
jgi:hypothetical protein